MRSRIRRVFWLVIDWLRAGYPDDAPAHGYSPLIALCGPVSLSQSQTRQVVAQLGGRPANSVEIGVAITKATGRLPTEAQVRKVSRALPPNPEASG
jgi:Protein of unknown function (DUF3349)